MGRMGNLFLEMREAEVDDYDYQYQQYLKENEVMASFDIYSNLNYLDYLSIQQLESLLPAYREDIDKKIRELINQKRNMLDATGDLINGENGIIKRTDKDT